ncbi:hypothetical protein CN639_30805 [Bacillus toyonensis]|uniref:hypothetical protein n=1 Tax=Bacillus cereus group TaxID=86661 RepID=UPI000B437018|nr:MULTISPECIES: hypothetical protein [Bacillus cereus group]OTX39859.1 hypothetical protein BK717_07350 [Bacillus thuringiensis serovar malayensis]OUB01698.1 hypothetical protein BK709_30355 [Bacillus thuringiensis serovar shandongiensis]MBH0359250.1 hypothetical protein [Bacillus toyonensis biovar Thuringiensis]MBJ8075271.1 hypothetical protein [Bacillus cereus group sp. N12]MBX0350751.1 hypothetical protein [Bacillus toyonensis]
MDAMLENIKLKKRLDYLSNLANENQELRESVKVLALTVEDLKDKVDMLSNQVSLNNSADMILGTLEDALTRIREYELMEGE